MFIPKRYCLPVDNVQNEEQNELKLWHCRETIARNKEKQVLKDKQTVMKIRLNIIG